MKKMKYILSAILLCGTMPLLAQETYENTKMVQNELNGTARYVGMGGALDALGADVSVIRSNPAGIALIRKSRADVSFGLVSQQDGKAFMNGNVTNPSFDQIGVVFAMQNWFEDGGRFNFAVNYTKSTNFDYILSTAGSLNNASQNTLSFIKAIGRNDQYGTSTFNVKQDNRGVLRGTQPYTSQLDNLYYNNFTMDGGLLPGYNSATGYLLNRANTGYIGTYDFNLSGSISRRMYLGMTVGLHDVHYRGVSEYTEQLVGSKGNIGSITVNDDRKITGTGVDFKLGAIFLPIENSPFRIGLALSSPTFYDLTTSNMTSLTNRTDIAGYNKGWATGEAYNFRLATPWKFGLSLGHTIENYLALGASYEYADYSEMKTRVIDGSGYDWYEGYYETSSNDAAMNSHTKRTLRGVSTLKLGMELKPVSRLALRAGYNYLSPMFKTDGYKDGSLDSYGSNYSSATDYVNWKAINRFTLGVGFTLDDFNIDLAYQYSAQDGQFYPFMGGEGTFNYKHTQTGQITAEKIENYADAVNVTNKRHQLLLTLGYRF